MQIRELEHELGAELVTRRQGVTLLTEAGAEIARRACSILGATRDLADCVRHSGPVLSGTLRLGVIPTLAPYVLPLLLPELHRRQPDLHLDLLETQTKTLQNELAQGTLDVLLLALPLEKAEFETMVLFSDRFLLAVPADDPLPERARVSKGDVDARELVLLEEGHCLRDQALIYCGERDPVHDRLGAASLATVLQMVAKRDTAARSRGRRRDARRARETPSLRRAAARTPYRAGLAFDLSPKDRFLGAWPDPAQDAQVQPGHKSQLILGGAIANVVNG